MAPARGDTIATLRPHIISVVLAVAFFAAAHLFLTAHKRYMVREVGIRKSMSHLRLLKEHHRHAAQQRDILEEVNSFVSHAHSLGLDPDQWSDYSVYIEDRVSFPKAEKIIEQTITTSAYYFKPVMLHIKKLPQFPDTKGAAQTSGLDSGTSPRTKGGDILLTLKGSFLVRH